MTGNRETPEELRAMLADELADADIYLDLLFQRAGLDRAACVEAKFNKTSQKVGYPFDLALLIEHLQPGVVYEQE